MPQVSAIPPSDRASSTTSPQPRDALLSKPNPFTPEIGDGHQIMEAAPADHGASAMAAVGAGLLFMVAAGVFAWMLYLAFG